MNEQESGFPMRINKYLAHKGYATRRNADALVERGVVFVNGARATVGQKVEEKDKVEVRVKQKPNTFVYIAYYKPKGALTEPNTSRKGERPKENELPVKGVFPVDTLERESEGLLILTDDGRITERLGGAAGAHEREYFVKTKEKLRASFEKNMEKGVEIEKEKTLPCKVHIFGERAFSVTLTENKRHQVRRMCAALFQEVDEQKRTRVINITLGTLAPGDYREIKGEELKTFLKELGVR